MFTFGSLLVAIQVAGGQLTPRIIATTLLRDNVVRYSVGLFVFTLVFAVMALNRLEDKVHEMVAFITACWASRCIVVFLFLIDYAARLLRPVSILARVADEGMHGDRGGLSRSGARDADEIRRRSTACATAPTRVVAAYGRSEIVLAVDLETLMREARRTERRGRVHARRWAISSRTDEPLFVLYGGADRHRRSQAARDRRIRT